MLISNRSRFSNVFFFSLAVWAVVGFWTPGLFTSAAETVQPGQLALSEPEKKAGIKIVSLRPTGGGQMLDLRFQVLDPEKAEAVLDKNRKAYLLDGKTGKALPVPVTKAGPMRQTTLKPEANRIYFILFSNPGGRVKENDKLTLVIGDFKREDIIVQAAGAASTPADKPTPQKAEHP